MVEEIATAPERPHSAKPVQQLHRPRAAAALGWLSRAGAWFRSRQASLAGLATAALLLEIALVAGWLRAFPLFGSPLFGYSAIVRLGEDPLVALLGDGPHGADRFLVLLLAVLLPYLLALRLAGRVEGSAGLALAAAGSLLFGVTALWLFPAGAVDIFHNIMDGRLLWLHRFNPLTVPPLAIANDPLFASLHYWQDRPSAYGPLWYLLTLPAVLAGGSSPTRAVVAFKALPFAFELICLLLIALIARRIDRRRVPAAIVCFGWNPLVLWETAGNGHNDAVMMAFVLLALLLVLTRFWPLALPALACSILVKYVSLVLLPVLVLWILRQKGRAALRPLFAGLAAAAALAVASFLPFWAGAQTFAQLGDRQHQVFLSPASALVGTWGEDLPLTGDLLHVERALTLAFLLLYAIVLWRMHGGRGLHGAHGGATLLIRACVESMFLVLVLMTWWFWPWYVLWGLALAALLPRTAHARLFVLFSATAMLIYISSAWRLTLWNFDTPFPMAVGSMLLVFTAPLLYAAIELAEGRAR